MEHLPPLPLPDGVNASYARINGLKVHYLHAGRPSNPCVLFLHGFPEIAFSWRHILPRLAEAGFFAIAPDQRGFGRTTGWVDGYDVPLAPYHMLALAREALALPLALGIRSLHAVVGHDFGSPVAAWCALTRGDFCQRAVLMSAPFAGAPTPSIPRDGPSLAESLLSLDRPRKHYQWYYSTPEANDDMLNAAQGVEALLTAYFYVKSGDWPGNAPKPLSGNRAEDFAELPTYYVMDAGEDMAETVAHHHPEASAVRPWLRDAIPTFANEYSRTGFQGGLNWYRARTGAIDRNELGLFAGRGIEIPTLFLSGAKDWGIHQSPGALARMAANNNIVATHLVADAGHWVQQEQPETVTKHLLDFLT